MELTERQWQAQIVEFAETLGWEFIYHTYDSRRSEPGFPDLHMLKGDRQIVAELKTATGRVTLEQREWMTAYEKVGAEVFLWRPDDWPEVEQVLKGELA